MSYSLPLTYRNSPPYAAYNDHFTREECGAILALGVALGPQVAQIGGSDGEGVVDPAKRASEVRWINWHPTNEWLFAKLATIITDANQRFFGLHLTGMNEPLQLTHYKGHPKRKTNGHYTWHEDWSEKEAFQFRKLSIVLPLNDGYKGGKFRFTGLEVPEQKIGTVIVFPSFKTHCVEPVTAGDRWSLVGWVAGHPFV
jgi:PKHD-type hydroxylase